MSLRSDIDDLADAVGTDIKALQDEDDALRARTPVIKTVLVGDPQPAGLVAGDLVVRYVAP